MPLAQKKGSEPPNSEPTQIALFADAVEITEPAIRLVLVSDNDMGPVTEAEVINLRSNLPDALFHEMEYVFRNYVQTRTLDRLTDPRTSDKQIELLDDSNAALGIPSEVFENLMWVFDLYETKTSYSFDLTCYAININPNVFRQVTAKQMKAELRACYQFIKGIDPVYAKNVAEKISEYVNVY